MVAMSTSRFQVEVLNQQHVFDDSYNEENTFDDCILDLVMKQIKNEKIKNFLKTKININISFTLDENVFEKLARIFENELYNKKCLIPSLRLDATFSIENINYFTVAMFYQNHQRWVNSTYHDHELFELNLEFPTSGVVNEVIC